MLGATDVGSVRVGASAGDVTELAAELVLSAAGHGSAPCAAAALRHLQRRLLLLVLLAFQVLFVGLQRSEKPSELFHDVKGEESGARHQRAPGKAGSPAGPHS